MCEQLSCVTERYTDHASSANPDRRSGVPVRLRAGAPRARGDGVPHGRMRGIRNATDRRVYLDGVERSQGKAWREALAAEYAADWERRKAAA